MDQSLNNTPGITPPPELVQQWLELSPALAIAAAFQAGADQELEACCGWLHEELKLTLLTLDVGLRTARRPKPPSLKEQALAVLDDAELDSAHYNILLRALEQLDD
jgi:hypothetical protein